MAPTNPMYPGRPSNEERARKVRFDAGTLHALTEQLTQRGDLLTDNERKRLCGAVLQLAALMFGHAHETTHEEHEAQTLDEIASLGERRSPQQVAALNRRRERRPPTVEEMVAYANRTDPDAPKP